MPATMGKNVRSELNREAMDIDALPDTLKEYARKVDTENTIDATEMLMAFGRALKQLEDSHKEMLDLYKEVMNLLKRPWWKKLCG